MQKSISYFQNEKGDFTLTVDDQPVGFVKDESVAQLLQSLEYQIDNLELWKREQMNVWGAVDAYMRKHPEVRLGESVSEKALKMLRERDAIFNIVRLLKPCE
jgi:hypothetical protein